ncbi:hypothetical protein VMCG_06149 [Cytospora schulzeri]|uniref:Uncharacterized protein n=1 Tax=Cytospora schulzeri TaxID=448051 RepID=A0A423WGH8_9PEZI|nr:hypothetical protein VMCG_06149 [Valsa malicola]
MACQDLEFLIIYSLLFLATTIILLLHGFHRLAWVGWGYLAIFCGLKIASNALQMTHTGTAVAVLICSIALVFLTLAVAFVLRAAGESHAGAGAMVLMLSIILICAVAVLGYYDLLRRWPAVDGDSDPQHLPPRTRADYRRERLGKRLILAAAVAGLCLAVRVGAGLHWFFGRGPEANPVTGRLAWRLGLSTLPELLAAVALVVGGVVTWDIAR